MAERNTRVIQLDPFFDRDVGDQQQYTQQQMPQQQTPIVHGGYAAPDQHTLNQMRPGHAGLRGTVIPKATLGGIPVGTRPHATSDVQVTIDPHIPGQSSTVRLGDLNPNNIHQAVRTASALTPEPTNIESLRVRGAAIMHTLANQSRPQFGAQSAPQIAQVVPQPIEQSWSPQYGQQAQYNQPVQQFGQPAPPAVPQQRPPQPRRVSPLSVFGQQQHQPPVREFRDIQMPEERQPVQTAGYPSVQVTFEMEHFGTLQANYHDVIIEQGFLVLVYDNRHKGSTRYFPPVGQRQEQGPRLAVNVIGTRDVYVVQTTGIQYEHEHNEFCVLMIDETLVLPEG